MLQHLDPQFLQRRLRAQRWIDRVLVELDRRQLVMPVGPIFSAIFTASNIFARTTASLPFTFLAAWAVAPRNRY